MNHATCRAGGGGLQVGRDAVNMHDAMGAVGVGGAEVGVIETGSSLVSGGMTVVVIKRMRSMHVHGSSMPELEHASIPRHGLRVGLGKQATSW